MHYELANPGDAKLPDQNSELDALLAAAVEISDPAERIAFLSEACKGDAGRLADLESMVNDYFAADGLLDPLSVVVPFPDQSPVSLIGKQIGPYILRELLGEGGMGSVYVAEQTEPVRRKVALKIIKPGMDSREVISRFEAERQALALMDHANIAKVLDGGTTGSGRPFFVMELVKGVPITEYCDTHKLGTRDRLRLFQQVCQAIQHAHQKGVIHRDLKPSNVLVSQYDTTPVVKVIDFGVAKAIGQQLTDRTLYTGINQMLGTPIYMSPEQAGQSGLDIDTRSDVYTLGVLLYELLTGSTPFTHEVLKKAGFDEMRRIIREVDPPLPSVRVSTLQGEPLSAISQQRKMEPNQLKRQLRGELDWIVMKAIDKDRNRRYESASGMGLEIERYLNDEPVLAGPPSATYRLQKFARRNRGALTTLSLICFAILGGGIAAAWQAIEATRARIDALNQEHLAETNFQKALDAVDQLLSRIGDEKLQNIPQMESLRKEILEDALRFYEDFQTQRTQDPEVRLRIAVSRRRIGLIQVQSSRYAEAEESTRAALLELQKLHEEFPGNKIYAIELAEAYDCMGWHTAIGKPSQQANYHQEAIRTLEPVVESESADAAHGKFRIRSRLGNSYFSMGARFREQNFIEDAERALRKAILMCEADPGWGKSVAMAAHHQLGLLFEQKGKYSEALAETFIPVEYQEFQVRTFPTEIFGLEELACTMETRGRLFTQVKNYKEADVAYFRAFELRSLLVEKYPGLVLFRERLKSLISMMIEHYQNFGPHQKIKDFREALEKLNEKILVELEKAVEQSPKDFQSVHSLFLHYKHATVGKQKKCLELAKRMTEIEPDNSLGWELLGCFHAENKNLEEANRAFDIALKISPQIRAESWATRGAENLRRSKYKEARIDFQNAVEISKGGWWMRKRLASACFYLGDYPETLHQLTLAVEQKWDDLTSLSWIPLQQIAACPDKSLRDGMIRLADRAVELNQGSGRSLAARAAVLLAMGQMEKATADLEKAESVGERDHYACYLLALLALNCGDEIKYQELCRKMIDRFGKSTNPVEKRFSIWTSLLRPNALKDYSPMEGMVLDLLRDKPEGRIPLQYLGALQFRMGKWEPARETLLKADSAKEDKDTSGAYTKLFLALTFKRLGQMEEAGKWLEKARAERQEADAWGNSWNRLFTLDLLEGEAGKVIVGSFGK